jgi:hypothetical protein
MIFQVVRRRLWETPVGIISFVSREVTSGTNIPPLSAILHPRSTKLLAVSIPTHEAAKFRLLWHGPSIP